MPDASDGIREVGGVDEMVAPCEEGKTFTSFEEGLGIGGGGGNNKEHRKGREKDERREMRETD